MKTLLSPLTMPECFLGMAIAGFFFLMSILFTIFHSIRSGVFSSECYPKISQVAHVVCVHKPNWSIQISGDMIRILPPRKSKGSSESKKPSSSKTSDHDKPPSVTSTTEPASSTTDFFTVTAPQKKGLKQPPSESKKTGPSTTVPPPRQKVSPKVQVATAVPKESDSKAHVQKSHLPPPKNKNKGPAKVKVPSDASEQSAEDAYDYEL